MDQQAIDFIENHSPEFIEMAFNYDRVEKLDSPDGYGRKTGDCGDTVEYFLVVDKSTDTINRVSLNIDGCVNTLACSNTVAMMTEGKTIADAWDLTPEAIADYLKTLEEDHFHCAELSAGAFFLALSNYWELKKNSWKKQYQDRQLSRG